MTTRKRICAEEQCTTILSRFNSTGYCATHKANPRSRVFEALGNSEKNDRRSEKKFRVEEGETNGPDSADG